MISIFSLLGEIIPRADKLRTAMVCVLMVINAALEVVSIGMVLPFITLFTTDAPLKKWPALERFATPIGITDDRELILFGCLVFFLVIALKSALTFAANVAVFRFIFMAQHRLAIELLNRHLHSNYIRASQVNSSEIINLLRQSVGFVYNGFIMPVTTALADALMILATAGIMLAVEPWATLAAAVAVGLPAVCLNYFLRPRLESLGHARERGNSQTLRALNEALGSLKEATVLRTRRYFLGRYADQDLNFNRIFVKWMTLNQIPRAILETAALGSIFVVVYVILQREGPKEHALAVLALFGAATLRTLPAALRIIQGLNQARFAKGGIETVWTALKDYPPVVTETHQHLPTVSPVHEITFQGVGYRYPSGGPVLHDVNLSLHRGEMVGIIGPSGAGKTTFVDLLMGLLKPTEGRITADGGDITAYGDRWLVHFGYVPQHVFMADDTIERNVAFGIPDDRIDRAAVDRALSAVRLDEFASQAPGRSSTYVGERGNKLSGGQLQRIGIARALYHNPEVLILDEPTSALNAELEREFLELVRGMKIDKTIIIISHRERMLDYCDRVLRVERGTVSESRKETSAA